MTVEEDFQDVLQNLEFAIVALYRDTPDLIDAEVLNAIESLIRLYSAEEKGSTAKGRPLRGTTKKVAETVKEMCEFRLGRSALETEDGQTIEMPEAIALSDLIACLRRIESSIKFWTKERGRQGYLNYIQNFMP
jgi:hypothetical protein